MPLGEPPCAERVLLCLPLGWQQESVHTTESRLVIFLVLFLIFPFFQTSYLKKEIEAEYYSVHAVRYDGIKYSSPDLRGSTLRALEKIEEKQDLYNRLLTEYVEIWDQIDEWFEELDDLLAESIVRCYYMMDKSWNETGRIVYEKNPNTPIGISGRIDSWFHPTSLQA